MRFHTRLLPVLVTAAAATLAASCSSASDTELPAAAAAPAEDAASQAVLTVDEIPEGTTIRVADQSGYLEQSLRLSGELDDTPYDVEFATFGSGPLVNEAIAAGRIDVGLMGDTPAIFAAAAGLDTRVVGVIANDGPGATIVARPGSGIDDLEDLEGHTVAYSSRTNQQGFVLRALDTVDLTEADIEQVDVPLTDVAGVLEAGNADAAVLYEFARPGYVAANPDAVELIQARDLAPVYTFTLATADALADPATAAALTDLVSRWARAYEWVAANPDTWIEEFYVKQNKQTPDAARVIHQAQGSGKWVPITPRIAELQQAQADLLRRAGELPEDLDISPQFDPAVADRFTTAITEAHR